MVEAVAGDTSKLALDHALATDAPGVFLGEDLGTWTRVMWHRRVWVGSGSSGSSSHSEWG